MWPTIFEFSWDTGHMIFFGVFYAVVIVISTSLIYAVVKSLVDVFHENSSEGRSEFATEKQPDKERVTVG
ncbi:MAG: hypothetical protein Kow0099_02910 [Candidatus Abyssubacteria bacterium]